MQLKKIDTESKMYSTVRNVFGKVSSAGTIWTAEAMSIPFVQSIVKNRIMRYACYAGITSNCCVLGIVGEKTGHLLVDGLAEGWNALADFVNGEPAAQEADEYDFPGSVEVKTKTSFLGIDIPDANATDKEEKEFVDALVETTRPFEFDTEEEAKKAVEETLSTVNETGFMDICYYFVKILGRQLPSAVYDICLKYGWTVADHTKWGVDKLADTLYVADMFNYHDISNIYKTL